MNINRRNVLSAGVAAGVGAAAGAFGVAQVGPARAAVPPKGKIPSSPLKVGHVTFLTGPAAVLGEPSIKGHTLAAEEINAQGGLLGKRKIETIKTDEAAGVDAIVKEARRMKLSQNVDVLTGVISSGTSPALAPVCEELGFLTLLDDGCTDYVFDRADPHPKYVFRATNIQSADGMTCARAVAQTWPHVKRIAHLHPDYAYGHNAYLHFNLLIERMIPEPENVSVNWPKLGTTDFTPYIPKIIASKPDLLFSSIWGGDYVSFYKQALRYGLFDKMKFASTIAFGINPSAIGKDHPEGCLVGCHANYYFTYPLADRWPASDAFVQRYHKRWNEYPNFEAEGAYTALYLLKSAIERANQLEGGWPSDETIISQLEGLGIQAPSGYLFISPDNHQGYKNTVTGFSKNLPQYPFPVWDPDTVMEFAIRTVSAPPSWPKPTSKNLEDTAAADWLRASFPVLKA
ncbi:MAG: ABC transporter substrate-binding protein [Acetobacteraceae bacterium]